MAPKPAFWRLSREFFCPAADYYSSLNYFALGQLGARLLRAWHLTGEPIFLRRRNGPALGLQQSKQARKSLIFRDIVHR